MTTNITAVGFDNHQLEAFRKHGIVFVHGPWIKNEETRDFLATHLYFGGEIRCYDDMLRSVGKAQVAGRQYNSQTGFYDYILRATKVSEKSGFNFACTARA